MLTSIMARCFPIWVSLRRVFSLERHMGKAGVEWSRDIGYLYCGTPCLDSQSIASLSPAAAVTLTLVGGYECPSTRKDE